MSVLSYQQLEQDWVAAGGPSAKAPVAAAVAEAESGGDPRSSGELNNNPSTGDYSVGPWQINYYGSLLAPRTAAYGPPASLEASPALDARAAVAISSQGSDFSPWTTYTSGAYLEYLPGGVASAGLNPQGGQTQTSNGLTPIPDYAPATSQTQTVSLIGDLAGDTGLTGLLVRGVEMMLGVGLIGLALVGVFKALTQTSVIGSLAGAAATVAEPAKTVVQAPAKRAGRKQAAASAAAKEEGTRRVAARRVERAEETHRARLKTQTDVGRARVRKARADARLAERRVPRTKRAARPIDAGTDSDRRANSMSGEIPY